MAVGTGPGTSISEVIAEIAGAQTSLQDCVDDAAGTFDNTYYTAPADRLTDFQGYVDTVDTTPPSAPTGLSSSNVIQTSFTLSWTASTDNVAVTGYKIYNDGVFHVDTFSTGVSKGIGSLTQADISTWTVKAYDAAGNLSAASTGILVSLLRTSVQIRGAESTSTLACASSTSYTTYYHDGPGLFPTTGDQVWINNSGIGTFNGGGDWFKDFNQNHSYEIDKNGNVDDDVTC